MKYCLTLFSLMISLSCFSQDKRLPIWISAFSNATTLPYSPELSPLHPGISAGTHFSLGKNLYQTARTGYFFHRFGQHAVQLYTQTGYRYTRPAGWFLTGRIGVGYLHSFPHTQIFALNDQGQYVRKKNLGRPQFMTGLTMGAGFSLEKKINIPAELFFDYQSWLQIPFVSEYVPILPNVSLHIGTILYFECF